MLLLHIISALFSIILIIMILVTVLRKGEYKTISTIFMVICLIGLINAVPYLYPLFFDLEHDRRSTVGNVQVDQRSLATALEGYYVDNSAYPAWSRGARGVNGFLTPGHPSYHVPTFRVWATKAELNTFTTLTTPQAYLTDYFSDLFVPDVNGVSFSYYSDDNGWI